MGPNGSLVEAKIPSVPIAEFSLTSVPFRPTTVQIPNLALIEKKLITVPYKKSHFRMDRILL